MKFDSNHIAIISTCTQQELLYLIEFIEEERIRHAGNIADAMSQALVKPWMASEYYTAVIRHGEDLLGIDAKVLEIRRLLSGEE